jgi:hypothetical protein
MQVAIITIGTRGDIQPYIALGRGLQAAGYDVKVVTFQAFESFVRGSGLDFAAVSGDLASLMTMDWTQSQIDSGGKSIGSYRVGRWWAGGTSGGTEAGRAVLCSLSSAVGSDERLSEFVLAVPDAATVALSREGGVQLDDPCVLGALVLAPVWQGAGQGAAEGVAPATFLTEAALSSALWV